jgi:serine protease Do
VGLDVVGGADLRDWKRTGGLRITTVAAEGPAVRAGLAAGDILLNARGRRLRTFLDWEAVLLDTGPGDSLVVDYRRDGRTQTARLSVTDLPSTLAEKVSVLGDLQAVTLTPQIRQERNIQTEHGALIYNMGAAAQRASGLQPGDVIFQINRQGVGSAEALRGVLAAAAKAGPVTVWFERGGMVGRTTFYVQ